VKIFATGITGLFGRYFSESNPDPTTYKIFGTSRTECPDETFKTLEFYEACPFENLDRYRELLQRIRPDVIVNAGSEGNVDNVQRDPSAGLKSNYEFPLFLLEEANKLGAKLVHFSSNSVYDGETPPYNERSPMNPLHLYGELKGKVDRQVRLSPGRWIILRPIVAYGWNFPFGRKNPVSLFLPMMLDGKPLKLVDDQFENPIYAGDVGAIMWKCLHEGFCGELNLAGADERLNRFEWMKTVASVFEIKDVKLEPTSMDSFPSLTPRPRDTHFDISKLLKDFHYRPLTVREGAEAMKVDSARTHLRGR
jgi:dTDP-4-dehydrorhamnose reductase